jgi:Cu2+-containing amine oxidase
MAVLALAAVAINDSNERTELVYRSSLENMMNPAAGSGKV